MKRQGTRSPNRPHHSTIALVLLALGGLLLPSCEEGGHFTVLGYTSRPNYDERIHTVYVPIFKNQTFYRGLEFDLTRAVVREIGAKTPFRVVSDCSEADTELSGNIITLTKNILNMNQLNEVREAETTLGVEVIWKDRRTGEILSRPRPPGEVVPVPPSLPPPTGLPGAPVAVPVPAVPAGPPPPPPTPTLVQAVGGFIPEVGESLTTAQQRMVNKLAVQIVSLMEKPW